MGDFQRVHTHYPDTAVFIFRIDIAATICRSDWFRVSEEILVWATDNGIAVDRQAGQAFMIHRYQNPDPDAYERAVCLFKVRWC